MLFQVENLTSGYGKIDVVRELSLHVDQGEHVGLFGPNGHGKTTLLRTVSGLIPANSGKIYFRGEDITGLSARKIVERGLIHVPQGNQLFPAHDRAGEPDLGRIRLPHQKGQSEQIRQSLFAFPAAERTPWSARANLERWRTPDALDRRWLDGNARAATPG